MNDKMLGQSGTFVLNKQEAIHRWYQYLEGYSYCLMEEQLRGLEKYNIETIYDPFAGTGTTLLVASQKGIKPYYSESNPFMSLVIEAKINAVHSLINRGVGASSLIGSKSLLGKVVRSNARDEYQWDGFECFFENAALSTLLQIKKFISSIHDQDTHSLLMLALSSISVPVSKMIRRGDLRYAQEKEKCLQAHNVKSVYLDKLTEMIEDVDAVGSTVQYRATRLSEDARELKSRDLIDCVITSPPYLNGTNYTRNTKIELKLNDIIKSTSDLPIYHSKGIMAGINSVSKRNNNIKVLDPVKPYIDMLIPVAYDRRIPVFVAGYFYDMDKVIRKIRCAMRNGGIFIMDIGDSQFAGIHIPTHTILSDIFEAHGFKKYEETILRKRRSKNGMALSQRLMKFKLEK